MKFSVPLDLVVSTGPDRDLPDVIERARRAERAGFGRVSLPEVTGRDAVTLLAGIATHTDGLGLSNEVFSPFSRSPGLLAQTAATLQELSGGRYRLGLGASSPDLVEGWHGLNFEAPITRLRETIEILRGAFGGGPVDYDGEIFELSGLELRCPVEDPPPIDLASLGPQSVRLAGRMADGWVPQLFTPEGLQGRREDLERGLAEADRVPSAVRVCPILRCRVGPDPEALREEARAHMAFMIGAYGPYYRKSLADQGYEELTRTVHEAWEAGDRERATRAVSDDLLDRLVAVGSAEEVRRRVEHYAEASGADALLIGFVGRTEPEDEVRTMEALAEGF